jgi:fibronectin type 3 domain-containing protein
MKKVFIVVLVMWISVTFANAESIGLVWDANTEGDLAGYKLYYGTSTGSYQPPIDVGNVTTYEVTELATNTTYYFALTAYDTSDNESEKSDEVSGVAQIPVTTTTTAPDLEPPPTPENFRYITGIKKWLEGWL